jgi:hypothetical protein
MLAGMLVGRNTAAQEQFAQQEGMQLHLALQTLQLLTPATMLESLLTLEASPSCSCGTMHAGVVDSLTSLMRTKSDPDARAIGTQLFALLVSNPAAKGHVEAALRGAKTEPAAADAAGDGG